MIQRDFLRSIVFGGTGVENFSKLGEGFYCHDARSLWVNQFFASEAIWKVKGVVVRQETRFPVEAKTRLVIQAKSPSEFSLNVRITYWDDDASVTINGERYRPNEKLAPTRPRAWD